MSEFKKCITNQNDIYVFFEIIRQIEPKSLLDVGMFLKRMGAVSRQVMDYSVPRDTYMQGVDFSADIRADVYHVIYDKLQTVEGFTEFIKKAGAQPRERFELAYMLYVDAALSTEQEQMFWQWLKQGAKYVLADRAGFERNQHMLMCCRYKEINVEDKAYVIVIMD